VSEWTFARLRPLWQAAVHFYDDNCLELAAAVGFYSLLSLAPFLYLVGSTLSLVLGVEVSSSALIRFIGGFLPPEVDEALSALQPDLSLGQGLILVALPVLLWVASTAFAGFQSAVNRAFGRAAAHCPWRSRLKGFAVLGAGWVFLALSLIAKSLLPQLESYRQSLGLPPLPAPLTGWLSFALYTVITYSIFVAFYRVLPAGKTQWRSAALGALVALVMWEVARQVFGRLLAGSHSYGLLTGTLAGLVAFLIWVYTAVAILLFGAELAGVVDGRRG